MPTVFTHAAIGYAAAKLSTETATQHGNITDEASRRAILLASMALAALPDADALFISVIPYNHPFTARVKAKLTATASK